MDFGIIEARRGVESALSSPLGADSSRRSDIPIDERFALLFG